MRKQFIQVTSSWIPISVLLLFTVALIAGQARANLPNEIKASPVPALTTSVSFVLHADMLRQLEVLPLVIDTLRTLPSDLHISIDARIISPREGGEHSPRSKSK